VIPEVIPMLTLKVPEELLAALADYAGRAEVSRHRAALLALEAGLRALRDGGRGGDTGGDTPVTPAVIPDAEALADLVAERVASRLAGSTGGDTGRRRRPADREWIEVHRNGLDVGLMSIRAAVELLEAPTGADVPGALHRLRDGALAELAPYLPGRVVTAPGGPVEAPEEAPESRSGRAPGQAPRRPGDYRIGGRRKSDPPEGSVGALLLTWRRARDLSQKEAADVFNVERKTWGRWETGERYPEAAVVERIKAEVEGG